ncbi:hypothetical protein [Nocardia sp. JMUB6875]|uniref:hypothetical protein n=1 Tax=Nocardia sp. JMUB6875 TaxID=3158170 RepID=UPI0034E88BEE
MTTTPNSSVSNGVPTSPGELVPPQTSREVSAPSAISPAQMRRKTCEDLLPRVDKLRKESGQGAVDQAVAEAIDNFPKTADWPVLTPEQQQAAVEGAHDAGAGKCT